MQVTNKFKTLIGNVQNGDIQNRPENEIANFPNNTGVSSAAKIAITLAKLQVALDMASIITSPILLKT